MEIKKIEKTEVKETFDIVGLTRNELTILKKIFGFNVTLPNLVASTCGTNYRREVYYLINDLSQRIDHALYETTSKCV